MTDTRPGTAQSQATDADRKAAAGAFFTHSLPPFPESQPPYYVRLFEEHLAALTANEAELVFDDFISYSRQLAALPPAEQVTPFQSNDGLQGVLDLPLSNFNTATAASTADGWEKRRAALRTYSQGFFQRACTVVSANIQHATVQTAAGFKRRNDLGGGPTYTSDGDGLYLHVWRSSSQARWFAECLKALQQAVFDCHVRSIRAPVASIFMYRGIIFTITAAIPVTGVAPTGLQSPVTWGPDSTPTEDSSAVARLDAPLLAAAVARHFCGAAQADGALPPLSSFGIERALDGRLYVTSLKWRTTNMAFALTDMPASIDANVWLRAEAAAAMDEGTRQRIRREYCNGSRALKTAANATARRYLFDTAVPQVAKEIMAAVAAAEGNNIAVLFKDSTVARIFHRNGLPLRCLYQVYDIAYAKVPNPEKRAQGPIYKGVREVLELEMANRTVKQMVRLEMRASPGEDTAYQIGRLNRLFSSITQKKTNVWTDQVHEVLRRKFEAPADFSIPLTAGLLKFMAAYASSRLGCAYDKASNRFTNFTAIHQVTTLFSLPSEVSSCIPNKDGYVVPPLLASNASFIANSSMRMETSASFGDGGGEGGPLSPSHSVRFAPTATSPNQSQNQSAAAAATHAGKEELQIDAVARQQRISELEVAWQSTVIESLGGDLPGLFTRQPPPSCEATVTDSIVLARIVRSLVMLRVLGGAPFDAKRKELLAAVNSAASSVISHFDPCIALKLRLMSLMDGMRMADADLIGDAVAAISDRLGKRVADDALHLGRLRVVASRVNGNIPGVVAGTKLFRSATWCDVGMLAEYFNNLVTSSASLNVNSDTATLAEVYRLANRVARRQDVTVRRVALITALRKTSSALVASQTQASCFGLREAMEEALKHHMEKFGPADIQTSVIYAQVVYIFVASHYSQLNDKQLVDVRKYHYQVSSMGTSSVDALKAVISSEQYNASLAGMLQILADLGDTIIAEKALNQAAGSIGNLDSKGARMASTVLSMQTGAAGRLQRMVRMATSVGPEHLIRRINFETMAYRQGMHVVEHDERDALARLELYERWLAPRARMAAFEDRQWARTLWFGQRKVYVVPPELPPAIAEAINTDEQLQRESIEASEFDERDKLEENYIKFQEMVKRMIERRDDFVFSETKHRSEFHKTYELACARIAEEGYEGVTRAVLTDRLLLEFSELTSRLKVELIARESLLTLVDRLTVEGDAVLGFVRARERILSGETKERTAIAREEDAIVTRSALESATIASYMATAIALHHTRIEFVARASLLIEETGSFEAIHRAYQRSGSGVSSLIAAKQAVDDEEQHARASLDAHQSWAKHVLRVGLDEGYHRLLIDGSSCASLAAVHTDEAHTRARVEATEREALLRSRIVRDEAEERDSAGKARQDGDARNRELALQRRRFEQHEESEREQLADELLSEASLMFRNEFARSEKDARRRETARTTLLQEESTARCHLGQQLTREAFAAVEEAERALAEAFAEVEWLELLRVATDPAELHRVRQLVADREAREQAEIERSKQLRRQHADEVERLFDDEAACRTTVNSDWIETTREGVHRWRGVLRAFTHFYVLEPTKRDAVAEAEVGARSRIAAAYRSDTRLLQQKEIAKERAAQRGAAGPVRALHNSLKAERVQTVRQEEATIAALGNLVLQTEAVKQQLLHDKVAAVQSRLPELREAARKEKAERRREHRAEADALIAATKAISASETQRATELFKEERQRHAVIMDANKAVIAQRIHEARRIVTVDQQELEREAAERRRLIEADAEAKRLHDEKLTAGRPVFSIVQSRAEALKEREETTRRTKREKEILAAIRYLDQRDEGAVAEERLQRLRAKEVVDEISRDALACLGAEDAKDAAARVRALRAGRASATATVEQQKRVLQKAQRDEHREKVAQVAAERVTQQRNRQSELMATVADARDAAERLRKAEEAQAAARREEQMMVAHQRVNCSIAAMMHEHAEAGHEIKSPVKAAAPLRHLPPIAFDHARMLERQAALLQSHLSLYQQHHSTTPPPTAYQTINGLSPIRARSALSHPASTPPPAAPAATAGKSVMNDHH